MMIGYSLERVSLNAGRVMFRERTVLGSLGCPSVDYPRVIDLVRQGRLRVSEVVTYRSLGRLAQLVQSAWFTPRRSQVRILYRPLVFTRVYG